MSEISLKEPIRLKEPAALQTPSEKVITEERKASLMAVQGYIILVNKPGDGQLYGTVENSFSIGIEPNRAFLYWTSAYRNIDGLEWAKKDVAYWTKQHPDYVYTIYDARDAEKLPVVLNWDVWLDAHTPSDKTMSGIKNKYDARNLRFTLKGTAKDSSTQSPAMTSTITIHSLV